jgi:hypothetical protein
MRTTGDDRGLFNFVQVMSTKPQPNAAAISQFPFANTIQMCATYPPSPDKPASEVQGSKTKYI